MIRRIIQIDEEKCNGCGAVLLHVMKVQSGWSMERQNC